LVNAQEEYVQALRHQNDLVMKASQERLLSLGVSLEQINLLQTQDDVKQHVVFYSPQKGVISMHKIREGQFVKPSQTLLEIVDLDSIWVIAEIFESQADWVKKGQRAKASLPYLPGKSIEGMVDYVYPSLDPKTRSLKVRLKFDNPEESIKPNMYADVEIYAKPKKKVLTIPREALISTGDDNRVIISVGEGKFIPMKVKVGMRTDKGVEILNGLAEGDVVVTSSQFLIDSESSLKASLAKMAGGG
jgi:Cu(I)/Ag(I) efflux system membrane fusion protein